MAETELANLSGQVSNGSEINSQPQPAEELIPKSQAENAIKQRVREAHESGYRKAMEERQSAAQQTPSPQPASGNVEEVARRIAREELGSIQQNNQKAQEAAFWNKVANDFSLKEEAAKQKYADSYKDTVAPIIEDLKSNPYENRNFIALVSGLENGEEVLKELAENPEKFDKMSSLAKQGHINTARAALSRISNSIKQNQAAQNVPTVNPPLSQIKPSNVGKDNGSMSISDYRKQDWLRS
jgi:hypothetical protein